MILNAPLSPASAAKNSQLKPLTKIEVNDKYLAGLFIQVI
jgi:hypothetical protein